MLRTEPLRRDGFTLIELMIVIAIIAILAAILIPNFIRSRAQSQLSACELNEKNLAAGLEMYSSSNLGAYPNANGSALPDPTATTWGDYVRANPTCPTNFAPYVYAEGSSNTMFTLSQGPVNQQAHVLLGIPANFPQYLSTGGLTP